MARRLCLDERARIEAMARAGLGAARIARCLGRHRSTVQRELARAGGPQGYRAGFAQQAAGARAPAACCAKPARYPCGPPARASSRWTVERCRPKHRAMRAAPSPAWAIASIRARSSRHNRRAILKTSTGRSLTLTTGHHGRYVATTGGVRRATTAGSLDAGQGTANSESRRLLPATVEMNAEDIPVVSGPWYAQEFQKLPSTGIPVLVCKLNRAGNPSPFDEPLVLPSRAVAGYCTSERCVQGPPSLAVWQRRSDGSGRYWNAWMCGCGWS